MKKIISSLALASSLTLGVFSIFQADMLTGRSIADDYIAGKLEARLDELGTDKQTGVRKPILRKTHTGGVQRHCGAVKKAQGVADYALLCKLEAAYYSL